MRCRASEQGTTEINAHSAIGRSFLFSAISAPEMERKEEPYHYVQKTVSAIIEELSSELTSNISAFRKISREIYLAEDAIIASRNRYLAVERMVAEEAARQKEVEEGLDYFEEEIERLGRQLKGMRTSKGAGVGEEVDVGFLTDVDSAIGEFNLFIAECDSSVPGQIQSLVSEITNMLCYAESILSRTSRQ